MNYKGTGTRVYQGGYVYHLTMMLMTLYNGAYNLGDHVLQLRQFYSLLEIWMTINYTSVLTIRWYSLINLVQEQMK